MFQHACLIQCYAHHHCKSPCCNMALQGGAAVGMLCGSGGADLTRAQPGHVQDVEQWEHGEQAPPTSVHMRREALAKLCPWYRDQCVWRSPTTCCTSSSSRLSKEVGSKSKGESSRVSAACAVCMVGPPCVHRRQCGIAGQDRCTSCGQLAHALTRPHAHCNVVRDGTEEVITFRSRGKSRALAITYAAAYGMFSAWMQVLNSGTPSAAAPVTVSDQQGDTCIH